MIPYVTVLARRLVLAKLDFTPTSMPCFGLFCFGAAVIAREPLTGSSLLTVRCHCLEEHPVDKADKGSDVSSARVRA